MISTQGHIAKFKVTVHTHMGMLLHILAVYAMGLLLRGEGVFVPYWILKKQDGK